MITMNQEEMEFLQTKSKWMAKELKCSIEMPCPKGKSSDLCCVSCPDYWGDCIEVCPEADTHVICNEICPSAVGYRLIKKEETKNDK